MPAGVRGRVPCRSPGRRWSTARVSRAGQLAPVGERAQRTARTNTNELSFAIAPSRASSRAFTAATSPPCATSLSRSALSAASCAELTDALGPVAPANVPQLDALRCQQRLDARDMPTVLRLQTFDRPRQLAHVLGIDIGNPHTLHTLSARLEQPPRAPAPTAAAGAWRLRSPPAAPPIAPRNGALPPPARSQFPRRTRDEYAFFARS